MEEVTVKCGCGRAMSLDGRRGRGAFRCGCGVSIQINEVSQRGKRCVGTASDGTACRSSVTQTDPLDLCEEHYKSTGLKQFHAWRTAGPEEIALTVGDYFDAAVFGRTNDLTPKELIDYRLQCAARAREAQANPPGPRQQDSEFDLQYGGQVYFVRLDSRVKIGKTYNIAQRLQSFANPLIQVLATEPGYTVRERQLHKQFEELRVAGEWFRLEDPLIKYIRNLPGYRGNLRL